METLRASVVKPLGWPVWLSGAGALFALRTTLAALIALYLAFYFQLDDPKWAPMTVWIVAQRTRGMSLSKGQYRMAGSVVGASAAVALVALFAQERVLFVLGLSLWLGACTMLASGLRNFRSYGAVLAGYTAAIVGLDAAAMPDQVFDIAVARVSNICLGILVEAVLTAVFAPGSPFDDVMARLRAYLRRTAEICARALRAQANTSEFPALFSQALELDAVAEYAAAGSQALRRRFGHLRAATTAALTQMAVAQTLREHLATHAGTHEPLIDAVAQLLDRAAAGQPLERDAAARLRAQIDEALRRQPLSQSGAYFRLFWLDRLDALLQAMHEAQTRVALLGDARAPRSRLRFSFHVDRGAAFYNGVRSFLGMAGASFFWIVTGWSAGPAFVVLTGVICSLYATRPNPVGGAQGFLRGGIIAVVLAMLCNFLLLPRLTAIEPLFVVLGLCMLGAGVAMSNSRWVAPATSFAFLFLDLVSPDNGVRPTALALFNGAPALLLGVLAGILVFALIAPLKSSVRVRRLRAALRADLREIGRHPQRWSARAWLVRTTDRLSQLVSLNRTATPAQAEADLRGMLAAMAIGEAVISLHELSHHDSGLVKVVALIRERLRRGDPQALARTAQRTAAYLERHHPGFSDGGTAAHVHAAVRLRALAEVAAAHADYLCR